MAARRALRRLPTTLTLAAVAIAAAAEVPFRLPVEELVLDNGMRVLLAPRPGTALVAAGWAARRGAGDEPPGSAGLAHLVEHLLHNGSRRTSASDFARHYTEAGAVGIDARTERDLTAYFLRLPPEHLELWFWLESDRLLEPAFGELERELRVIAEERRQRLESTPSGLLDEELQRLFWGEQPYGASAGGAPEALARLRRGDAEAFFARHYGAADLTAVLVGDFSPERARELVRRYFGRLPRVRSSAAAPDGAPRTAAAAATPVVGAVPGGGAVGVLDRACACPPQSRVLYPTVPAGHADRPALDVLAGVLAGRSGRLHRALVIGGQQRQLAFAAAARHEVGRQGGVFAVEMEARGATAPPALVDAWDAEVARLQQAAPAADELLRVRNQVTTDAWRGMREPIDFALRLLVADAQAGWRTLETWPAAVSAVRGEDVQRVAKQYLVAERRLVVRVARRGGR
jgi:predicted Zn-dependent peptidase